MMTAGWLLLVTLAAPSPLQGPIAILDSAPQPDTALHADLEALLEDGSPLYIQLTPDGPSDLDRKDRVLLRRADTAGADERILSERVLRSPSVILEGGSLLAWHETLYRARRPTRLVHALSRHSREGRAIVGVGGAGAALAAGGIVKTADLEEVQRNPRRAHELEARVALGWGPPALVDADAWGGEPMRTLRLLERSHMAQAAHLGESSGLILEAQHKRVRVIGEGGVTFFETAPGRRNRHDLRGGSVSSLTRGDIWDLAHSRIMPAALDSVSPRQEAFTRALMKFAAAPEAVTSLESPWGLLLIRQRVDTRFTGPDGALRPIRAEFDLLKSP